LGGTYGGGIDRLNRQTGRIKHYLAGTSIFQVYEDSRGNLWAGTEKGLYRYNQKEDQFAAFFDPLSELNSYNIHDIVEDNAKNLWLTSPSAIIKLNPVTTETFIYDSKVIIPKSRYFARTL
jgi:ligand-binding sensor domain-containing protein